MPKPLPAKPSAFDLKLEKEINYPAIMEFGLSLGGNKIYCMPHALI